MSTPDAAGEQPQRAAVEPETAEAAPAPVEDALEPHVPVIEETEHEVVLQRTVRYGRVLIGGAVLGAIVAMLACLLFPVPEDAEYTMGQAVGISAIIGGAIGLGIAGLFSIVLGFLAKRGSGVGVAIQRDVR
ncbi:hypothetical protein [Leucobacter chironomi]|uniref:hypothetical protein n=1 Tax=Leucobacter chironomi TaxID=491918 RepID=UPI0004102F76|nr:hypothetical protein [Leucobacter chironomi]